MMVRQRTLARSGAEHHTSLRVRRLVKQKRKNPMRFIVPTVMAIGLITSAAFAQTPAQQGPQNPAVKSMDQNNSAVPVAGKNSFTRAQARSHIEAKGYTGVKGLKLDQSGVWRGTAMKDGQSGPVSVDYQGNVN
jgi:hypothetical protein